MITSDMENNFAKDITTKIKALGLYQIIGGIIGMLLTIWLTSGLTSISGISILLIFLAMSLYAYSIYCGTLLLKKNISGLNHSLVNQFLQLINFFFLGFAFQYTSGVFFTVGIDLTESFYFTFNVGISSWKIAIGEDAGSFIVNFNCVALFMILLIDKLKRSILKEEFEKQITSIGEY